ncbi:hypothetical protein BDE36_2499 [Arcticibacter tournemirensis]|nr:hypothetical protein BDE36_2499 [Arcticibacter tournemirensis]
MFWDTTSLNSEVLIVSSISVGADGIEIVPILYLSRYKTQFCVLLEHPAVVVNAKKIIRYPFH